MPGSSRQGDFCIVHMATILRIRFTNLLFLQETHHQTFSPEFLSTGEYNLHKMSAVTDLSKIDICKSLY